MSKEDLMAEIVVPLMNIMQMLIPLIVTAVIGLLGFKYAMNFWVEAQANEWLLVIRNGQLMKKGIGLCSWTFPGDQTVKFPSLINQVNFTAQQVSAEMQGIEVTGMLVWSVYREEDGPMSCYKFFGDDLKKATPHVANGKIEAMAVAIIRDRIANLTINDILKNRSKLRGGVKEEMQKILTGWGIWLETCEIQDVKISSRSLFTNLQTEFREAERLKAEKISADTENIIKEENLVRISEFSKKQSESDNKIKHEQLVRNAEFQRKKADTENEIRQEQLTRETEYQRKEAETENQIKNENLIRTTEYQRKQAENAQQIKQDETAFKVKQEKLQRDIAYQSKQAEMNNQVKQENLERDTKYQNAQVEASTKQQIHDASQRLEVTKHEGLLFEEELKIEKQREELANAKAMAEAEMDVVLQKKKMELNNEKDNYETQLEIAREAEQRKLKAVQFEGRKIEVENALVLEQLRKDQAFEQQKKELQIKNECYTPNVLKSMVLDTTKDIYRNLSIRDMRVVNMGGNGANGNQDPAGQLLAQMMASYKTISDQMDSK